MIKRLATLLFTAALITGIQATSITQSSWAKELSKNDCPVKFSGKITSQINDTSCYRQKTNSNSGYYYINNTSWDNNNSLARVLFMPIKSYQYWKKLPKSEKKNVHDWDELNSVNLDDIIELKCSGYACYTFQTSDNDGGHCLWFSRYAKKGSEFIDSEKATGILSGYTCSDTKENAFNVVEAMDFIKDIYAK